VSEGPRFEFDRQRRFTDLGTRILSRFLMRRPRSLRLENVEHDRSFQRRDIDLIWHRAIRGHEQTTLEIKCDAHVGVDEALARSDPYPYYALRTDNFAVETVSNDGSGTPGWVFASEAEMLLYYFVAIPRTVAEIEELSRIGEDYLLANLGVVGDRLYVLDLSELRNWFTTVQNNYREVAAQNEGYRTLSRLAPCQDVVNAIKHCRVFDDVYQMVINPPAGSEPAGGC